jgi:hypothetical protein
MHKKTTGLPPAARAAGRYGKMISTAGEGLYGIMKIGLRMMKAWDHR